MAGERNAARAAGDHLLVARATAATAARTARRGRNNAAIRRDSAGAACSAAARSGAITAAHRHKAGTSCGARRRSRPCPARRCAACDNCLSPISVCYAMTAWWVSVSSSRPATAGRGDRAERGGRGAGLNAPPATTTKRRVRGPLHHASRGPPPPLSRGRMQYIPVPARTCARECCRTTMSNASSSTGLARMVGADLRQRSSSGLEPPFARMDPGSAPAMLRTNKRKEAERRQTRYSTTRTQRRAGRATEKAACAALPLSGALACRRSTTALAAATERHRSAPVHALPGTELVRDGRYPPPAVPVQRAM